MDTRITRILAPVDFSPPSTAAVRFAATLARALDARLELIHIVEDPFMSTAWGAEAYVSDLTQLLDSLTVNATSRLEQLKTVLADVATETEVLRGEPWRQIVEHASASKADLIVMGTHGHTGLSHVLLGSVAEHVVRQAPCPVLTVREPARHHRAAGQAA